MAIGPAVRALFGPYEREIAHLYRSVFIDLDDWSDRIGAWVPSATNILEVGCGEGAMTERLQARYPLARITAIDVTPRVGRLFSGDRDRVEFLQINVEDIAARNPQAYDLIVLSDVIHHVPKALRGSILTAIHQALAPGGMFVFKDWARTATPIHWMCHAGDRYLTGDRVSYLDEHEIREFLSERFGTPQDECRVRPWRNNFAVMVRKAS